MPTSKDDLTELLKLKWDLGEQQKELTKLRSDMKPLLDAFTTGRAWAKVTIWLGAGVIAIGTFIVAILTLLDWHHK